MYRTARGTAGAALDAIGSGALGPVLADGACAGPGRGPHGHGGCGGDDDHGPHGHGHCGSDHHGDEPCSPGRDRGRAPGVG